MDNNNSENIDIDNNDGENIVTDNNDEANIDTDNNDEDNTDNNDEANIDTANNDDADMNNTINADINNNLKCKNVTKKLYFGDNSSSIKVNTKLKDAEIAKAIDNFIERKLGTKEDLLMTNIIPQNTARSQNFSWVSLSILRKIDKLIELSEISIFAHMAESATTFIKDVIKTNILFIEKGIVDILKDKGKDEQKIEDDNKKKEVATETVTKKKNIKNTGHSVVSKTAQINKKKTVEYNEDELRLLLNELDVLNIKLSVAEKSLMEINLNDLKSLTSEKKIKSGLSQEAINNRIRATGKLIKNAMEQKLELEKKNMLLVIDKDILESLNKKIMDLTSQKQYNNSILQDLLLLSQIEKDQTEQIEGDKKKLKFKLNMLNIKNEELDELTSELISLVLPRFTEQENIIENYNFYTKQIHDNNLLDEDIKQQENLLSANSNIYEDSKHFEFDSGCKCCAKNSAYTNRINPEKDIIEKKIYELKNNKKPLNADFLEKHQKLQILIQKRNEFEKLIQKSQNETKMVEIEISNLEKNIQLVGIKQEKFEEEKGKAAKINGIKYHINSIEKSISAATKERNDNIKLSKTKIESEKKINECTLSINELRQRLETEKGILEDIIENNEIRNNNEQIINYNTLLKSDYQKLTAEKLECDKKIGEQTQIVNDYTRMFQKQQDLKKELAFERDRLILYTQYLKIISRSGVQHILLSEKIKEIVIDTNKLLEQNSKLQIKIQFIEKEEKDNQSTENEEKNTENAETAENIKKLPKTKNTKQSLLIYCVDKKGKDISFDSSCGSEQFKIDLALKLALIKQTNTGSEHFMIIDESFTTFDQETLHDIDTFLLPIKEYFCHLFIISHLPQLEQACKYNIEIKVIDGFSHVDTVNIKITPDENEYDEQKNEEQVQILLPND